ncbi:MAG: hypothetical protein HY898_06490 [Deltaproteobacteria bacterium]|nr:hypothetical protein [Deltaproteobacteria bacterium]
MEKVARRHAALRSGRAVTTHLLRQPYLLAIVCALASGACSSDSSNGGVVGDGGLDGAAGAGGGANGGNGGSGATGTGGSGATGTGGSGATGTGGSGATGTGGTGATGTGGSGGGTTPCDGTPKTYTGDATYYDFADGSGNCGFPATPNDLMVGAMNQTDYAGSAACGACAQIQGPDGTITIRVVDRCPECKPGDIDLSPSAFAKIADPALGRVTITWNYVECPVTGNIIYHFKDGSNPWWTAVQIRNHRYAIQSVEYLSGGSYKAIERLEYNYFVEPSGMGDGPYTLRVTDVHGHVLEDSGIPGKLDNADAPGASQFPACAP